MGLEVAYLGSRADLIRGCLKGAHTHRTALGPDEPELFPALAKKEARLVGRWKCGWNVESVPSTLIHCQLVFDFPETTSIIKKFERTPTSTFPMSKIVELGTISTSVKTLPPRPPFEAFFFFKNKRSTDILPSYIGCNPMWALSPQGQWLQ